MRETRDGRLGWHHWLVSSMLACLAGCVPLDVEEPQCFVNDDCERGGVCVDRLCVDRPADMVAVDRAPADLGGPEQPDCAVPIPCEIEGMAGRCATGTVGCSGRCLAPDVGPGVEECNGVDDDCDGVEDADDDDIEGQGDPCEVEGTEGACSHGVRRCIGGEMRCLAPEPSAETCDGEDDDCDGTIDEVAARVGEDCSTGLGGLCVDGVHVCRDGVLECEPDAVQRARQELCDGLDQDCDGDIDEGIPVGGDCEPIEGLGAGRGFCARGRQMCHRGELRCIPWMPDLAGYPDRAAAVCDLLDQDCDGAVDEPGEQHFLAGVGQMPIEGESRRPTFDWEAIEALIEAEGGRPAPMGAGPRGAEFRLPAGPGGPLTPHACLPRSCLADCSEHADDDAYHTCLAAALAAGTCVQPAGVEAWACEPGPTCTVVECGPYFEHREGVCVPLEICNNGLDDDGDGLVDGTLGDPEACEAFIETAGVELAVGLCANPGADPRCAIAGQGPWGNGDEVCRGGECPFTTTLTYDYAIDREEVSNRAYRQCVRDGCCTPAQSSSYASAVDHLASEEAFERPPPGERETRPMPIALRDITPDNVASRHLFPDLPVTGVSWCQARDFCHWAGKRLVTEVEWERAAAGPPGDRRMFPWGPEPPPHCPLDGCCRTPDGPEDPLPLMCPDIPLCADEPADGYRGWRAGYAMSEGICPTTLLPGVAPVWAYPDGATPSNAGQSGQIFNLAGNVGEWVFDRIVMDLVHYSASVSDTDPVGLGCMPPDPNAPGRRLPDVRVFRGGNMTNPRHGIRSTNRMGVLHTAQLPLVGFRCARTLADDRLCSSDIPIDNEVSCGGRRVARAREAGAHIVDACAPRYTATGGPHLIETAACQGVRQRAANCGDARIDICAAEETPDLPAPGCGAYVISSLQFDGDVDPNDPADVRGEAVGSLDALFTSALAPNGGGTYLVLDLEEGFGYELAESALRFGTAMPYRGALRWVGRDDGGCQPLPVAELPEMALNGTCCGRPDFDLCGDTYRTVCPSNRVSPSYLLLAEAPMGVQFGSIELAGSTIFPTQGRMTGTVTFYISENDADQGIFGDPNVPSRGLIAQLGEPADDMCGDPQGTCERAVLPGCDGRAPCAPGDRDCTGWTVSFNFEAIRVERAIADGRLRALSNMACEPPACPGAP